MLRCLVREGDSTAFQAWGQIAQKTERIVSHHVRKAFENLRGHMRMLGVLQPNGEANQVQYLARADITAILALAGSDAADHVATMKQVEQLIRVERPDANVALVSPEDFRNLAWVTRCICDQVMSSGNKYEESGADDDDDEGETEDLDGNEHAGARKVYPRASVYDFIDQYQQEQRSGPLVLCIQQADGVPKDQLRDMLSCWGTACSDASIPVMVIFGLHHLPQSRFDLLEGEPLVTLSVVNSLCLFNAREVSAEIIEYLAEDDTCPLVLSPDLLTWLRHQFMNVRFSVSYILKVIALLCHQLEMHSPLSTLCLVQEEVATGTSSMSSRSSRRLEQAFKTRLGQSPNLVEHLKPLWPEECSIMSEQDTEVLKDCVCEQGAKVAAQALQWRRRLCASLKVWDELLCAVQPITRHEARLRRLVLFLEPVWPKPASTDAVEILVQQQQDNVKRRLAALLQPFSEKAGPLAMSREDMNKLVVAVTAAAAGLERGFQMELQDLQQKSLSDAALASGLRNWFTKLQGQHWHPMPIAAQKLFLAGFACPSAAAKKVLQQLGNTHSYVADTTLVPLAEGMASGPLKDMTLLYRIFECVPSRSMDIADLWKAFSTKVGASSSGGADTSAITTRFVQALLALHQMGLHKPYVISGKSDKKFGGWRTRKCFAGRVWLKRKGRPWEAPTPKPCNTEGQCTPEAKIVETACASSDAGQLAAEDCPKPTFDGAQLTAQAVAERCPQVAKLPRKWTLKPLRAARTPATYSDSAAPGKKRARIFFA